MIVTKYIQDKLAGVFTKYIQDKLAGVFKKDLTNISIHLRIVTTTLNFYSMFRKLPFIRKNGRHHEVCVLQPERTPP